LSQRTFTLLCHDDDDDEDDDDDDDDDVYDERMCARLRSAT